MKCIRALTARTPGLAEYLEIEGGAASWQRFQSHNAGAAKQELVDTLVDLQHGLCGYCEIDLTRLDRQVEHFVPRSDPAEGSLRALDVGNLIACCKGGTERVFAPDVRWEEDRYLKPLKHNRSCGQAKDDGESAQLLDPRALPALPSLTKVSDDGRIEPDVRACASVRVDITRVADTIVALNLNAERLRLAREKRWRALNEVWGEFHGDQDVMDAAARGELSLQDGRLPRFFTTSRCFFGLAAERVLAEKPQVWI